MRRPRARLGHAVVGLRLASVLAVVCAVGLGAASAGLAKKKPGCHKGHRHTKKKRHKSKGAYTHGNYLGSTPGGDAVHFQASSAIITIVIEFKFNDGESSTVRSDATFPIHHHHNFTATFTPKSGETVTLVGHLNAKQASGSFSVDYPFGHQSTGTRHWTGHWLG